MEVNTPDYQYTSLKDLLSESPPSTASPPSSRRDSWLEIPIKDPLLKHAAWAYLQAAATERRIEDDRRWWRRLRRKVGWLFDCFNDVVSVAFDRGKSVRRVCDERESDER